MKARNLDLLPARKGLEALNGIGSKDKVTVKRLAKMLRALNEVGAELDHAQMGLVNAHAARDEHNHIKLTDDKAPVFVNIVEYNIAAESLMYDETELGDLTPFSAEDLERFSKYPDAQTLAMCGPFVTLD